MKRYRTHQPIQMKPIGFTLIELMVTIAVLSILLSIAIPSFTAIIRSNQISSAANNLVGSLNMARSEASKRHLNITVCASTDGTTCSQVTNWGNGWVLFTDTDSGVIGTIDGADQILSKDQESTAGLSIASNVSSITFVYTGAVTFNAVDPITFTTTKTGSLTSEARLLCIHATVGRVKLFKGISTCPAF